MFKRKTHISVHISFTRDTAKKRGGVKEKGFISEIFSVYDIVPRYWRLQNYRLIIIDGRVVTKKKR